MDSKNTFPILTDVEREKLDLYLAATTKVSRPVLIDHLTGILNSAPIVEKVGNNDAWKILHASKASVYADESSRKRKAGSSQVETIRRYIQDRFYPAWAEAFGKEYPAKDAFKIFDGKDENLVDIWRIR